MPLYDLMLLLDPTAPSDRRESIIGEAQKLIESGGKIAGVHDWGQRKMTFEINHRPEADYHLIQFETEKGSGLLERVDHALKIMDGVLRHRIIKLKDGSPPPPTPRPEGRRDAPAEEAPTNGQAAPAGVATVEAPAATAEPAAATPAPPAEAPAPPSAEEAAAPAPEATDASPVAAPATESAPTTEPAGDEPQGPAAV